MGSIKRSIRNIITKATEPVFEKIEALSLRISTLEDRLSNLQQLESIEAERRRSFSNSNFVETSQTEVLAKIFSGAKMFLDKRDVGLVPHLLLDGEWERDITHAWMSTVQPKDVVLDIGANFGYFGILAAQQAQRDCKVIMFEANPNLKQYIQKTINVNSFQDCSTVEQYAVADKKGTLKLNVLKDYIASSSIKPVDTLNKYNHNGATFELQESIAVPAIAIDDFCKKEKIDQVNVIKMDIEGFEDIAYLGMRKTVQSSKDITMFIEFTKDAYKDPRAFYEMMLEDFGAVFTIAGDGGLLPAKDTAYESVIDQRGAWSMPVFSKTRLSN